MTNCYFFFFGTTFVAHFTCVHSPDRIHSTVCTTHNISRPASMCICVQLGEYCGIAWRRCAGNGIRQCDGNVEPGSWINVICVEYDTATSQNVYLYGFYLNGMHAYGMLWWSVNAVCVCVCGGKASLLARTKLRQSWMASREIEKLFQCCFSQLSILPARLHYTVRHIVNRHYPSCVCVRALVLSTSVQCDFSHCVSPIDASEARFHSILARTHTVQPNILLTLKPTWINCCFGLISFHFLFPTFCFFVRPFSFFSQTPEVARRGSNALKLHKTTRAPSARRIRKCLKRKKHETDFSIWIVRISRRTDFAPLKKIYLWHFKFHSVVCATIFWCHCC